MELWRTVLLAVLLPAAATGLLLAVALFFRRRRRRRFLSDIPLQPPDADAAGMMARPGLAKHSIPYSTSGGASLRFQQLHHHHDHDVRHRVAGGAQRGTFQWADHPRLVTEAVENGWAQFVFAFAPPRSRSAASSPLWGLCPICDAGTNRDMAEAAWDVPPGSSERMQAVRLNPATSAAASSKRRLPGSIPSPLRGDHDLGNHGLCLARMSLPLPGPPLAGSPFPQEAYFEITIIYLNTRRPEWSASRASKRGRDGSGESDRVKLIGDELHAKVTVQETRTTKDDHQDKQRHLVMSVGLAAASAELPRASLPGTYMSSIGFHSNGAVYLDGMKLAYESEKSAWAAVDRVVGCGYEPAKRKVFFTVDGQLAHAVSCNSDAYFNPLYPVLAANFDVMALVNLGQAKFRYAPANARRTTNPCFLRAAGSQGDGRSGSTGLDLDDSGDLFSMGRVDSGWLETSRMSKSKKETTNAPADLEAESELFEIALRD